MASTFLTMSLALSICGSPIPVVKECNGVSCKLSVATSDDSGLSLVVRFTNSGGGQFLFNPQFASRIGVPGRIDVYDPKGVLIGDLLPALNPFATVKRLHPHHWLYLNKSSSIESTFQFGHNNLEVVRGLRIARLVPGRRYTFQLVVDERLTTTPSILGRFKIDDDGFQIDDSEMQSWQLGHRKFKDVMRSNAVSVIIPRPSKFSTREVTTSPNAQSQALHEMLVDITFDDKTKQDQRSTDDLRKLATVKRVLAPFRMLNKPIPAGWRTEGTVIEVNPHLVVTIAEFASLKDVDTSKIEAATYSVYSHGVDEAFIVTILFATPLECQQITKSFQAEIERTIVSKIVARKGRWMWCVFAEENVSDTVVKNLANSLAKLRRIDD